MQLDPSGSLRGTSHAPLDALQIMYVHAVRSVVGFGAGVVSPVVFGWALDASGGSWGIAWVTLALGAMFGPLATWRLRRS